MNMPWKSSAILAIDLGIEAVRLVEVRPTRGGTALNCFAEHPVAEGPAAELPERQLTALGDLLATQRVRTRRAIAAMPASLVLTRTVQLDRAKGRSMEEQIRWTLQNCLPFDPRDLIFDYWPISAARGSHAGEVTVVATQRGVVEKYLQGMEQLGLKCTHLDVAPCALATLIGRTLDRSETAVGAVALTGSTGVFAIVEGARVLLWRPFDLQEGPRTANVGRNLDRMGEEISKCVSHMVGSMHIDNLGELLLFGQDPADNSLSEYLHTRFHLPIRTPSPFAALGLSGANDILGLKESTHYCTAVGLAMQTAPEGAANG